MNRCTNYGIECPYALSGDSPLPCYGTQEQCDEYRSNAPKDDEGVYYEDRPGFTRRAPKKILEMIWKTEDEEN